MFHSPQIVWSPNDLFFSPFPLRAEPSDLATILRVREGSHDVWYQLLLRGEVVELPERLIKTCAHVVNGN